MGRVLVIDGDAARRVTLAGALGAGSHEVETAGAAATGTYVARVSRPDLIIVESVLPDGLSTDVATALLRDSRNSPGDLRRRQGRAHAPRIRPLLRLVDGRGRALARETIVADVWPEDAPSQRVVDTTLKRLRRKLPAVGRRIRTIRGVGYELTEDDSDAA